MNQPKIIMDDEDAMKPLPTLQTLCVLPPRVREWLEAKPGNHVSIFGEKERIGMYIVYAGVMASNETIRATGATPEQALLALETELSRSESNKEK